MNIENKKNIIPYLLLLKRILTKLIFIQLLAFTLIKGNYDDKLIQIIKYAPEAFTLVGYGIITVIVSAFLSVKNKKNIIKQFHEVHGEYDFELVIFASILMISHFILGINIINCSNPIIIIVETIVCIILQILIKCFHFSF